MIDLPEDFRDLLLELDEAGAEFVVLGGHAVAFHGHPRATKDLDVLVRASAANAARVYRALASFGAPLDLFEVAEADFATYDGVLQIGLPPRRIDILNRADGISFDEAIDAHALQGLVKERLGAREVPVEGASRGGAKNGEARGQRVDGRRQVEEPFHPGQGFLARHQGLRRVAGLDGSPQRPAQGAGWARHDDVAEGDGGGRKVERARPLHGTHRLRVDAAADGSNLHRNVIFRDGKSKADQIVPISQYDAQDPEKLREWMAADEKKTGGRLLAIPHGGNLSNGLMFDDVTLTTKKPLDRDYAERRMRFEPLVEVTQMKGDAEAHPFLSPSDEFADFETWDKASFGAQPKTKDMLPREYAREAYKRGLAYEAKLGVNPFKFGIVGSTDSHTSLATTEENNLFGKVILLEPSADPIRFEEVIAGRPAPKGSQIFARETSASGLAAVWARDNTRAALWTPCRARRCLPRPAPASWCASSAASTTRPGTSRAPTSPHTATPRACPWAAT